MSLFLREAGLKPYGQPYGHVHRNPTTIYAYGYATIPLSQQRKESSMLWTINGSR
jgi:hypothetical protein